MASSGRSAAFDRRTLLLGAGAGVSTLVLTACTAPANPPGPTPTATPTSLGEVPAPVGFERSNWSNDPYARGSLSYLPVGATPEHRAALAEPLLDRVFFAGEATSIDAAGTVAGARASGARAAADLLVRASAGDRVVVIGAGAAGAEAARRLALADLEVQVLDARDRVGGRIRSIDDDAWPVSVELGSWLLRTEADRSLLADLNAVGVATARLSSSDHVGADGVPADASAETAGAAALEAAAQWAVVQSADTDVATALEDSGAASSVSASGTLTGPQLLAHELALLAIAHGAPIEELSSWYGLGAAAAAGADGTGADGTDTDAAADVGLTARTAVTGRYATLVEEALAEVPTYLATVVNGVSYTQEGVSIRLATGESLAADRVIVTAPLGVLHDDAIEFTPLLPFAHRTAIAALGMGTVDTVWLRFDEPFWESDAIVWHLVGTEHDLTVWVNLLPVTGRAVLVGLVGGEAALRLAELDDAELTEAAQQALAPFAVA